LGVERGLFSEKQINRSYNRKRGVYDLSIPGRIIKPIKVPLPTNRREKIMQLYADYLELHTLRAVGNKYGRTREWTRQYLSQGNQLGYFTYPLPVQSQVLTAAQIIEAYAQNHGRFKIARALHVTPKALALNIKQLNMDHDQLQALQRALLEDKQKAWYDELVEKLGYHPSSTYLQRSQRNGYMRLTRIFGSIANFRQKYGYVMAHVSQEYHGPVGPQGAPSQKAERTLTETKEFIVKLLGLYNEPITVKGITEKQVGIIPTPVSNTIIYKALATLRDQGIVVRAVLPRSMKTGYRLAEKE
jgi:hypothetical protein